MAGIISRGETYHTASEPEPEDNTICQKLNEKGVTDKNPMNIEDRPKRR